LGVGGDGVQLGGADIVLGQRGGQRGHKQVDHDQQRQHHRRDDQRVGAAQQRHLAVHRRGGLFFLGFLFTLISYTSSFPATAPTKQEERSHREVIGHGGQIEHAVDEHVQ